MVVAAVFVPGTKKFTSVMGLLTAVNSFCGLKAWKSFGKPNSGGVAPPAFALTRKPVPGVENTAPRGELVLKKSAGKALGSENDAGTPSQLISRRRPPKEPLAGDRAAADGGAEGVACGGDRGRVRAGGGADGGRGRR